MSNSQLIKLGDVVEINKKSISKEFSWTEIEYVDTASVIENRFESPIVLKLKDAPSRAKRLANVGDTIISTVRPIQRHYGFLKVVKPNTVYSTGFAIVSPTEKINPRYLYYYLSQERITLFLNNIAEGGATTFPAFKPHVLNDIEIKLPPLKEQKEIAEILSSLDDKIELNDKINQELENLAQTIFKRWFIDFEFPNENGNPYKSSGGEMVETGDKTIPYKWKEAKIDEIIEFNPTEKLSKGIEAPYLDMASLSTQGSYPEPPKPRKPSSGMKFRNGDTLLARITPCLENGKTAFIQCLKNNEVGWGSTEFIVMRMDDRWPKEFSYIIAKDQSFRNYAIQSMVGTSGRQRVQNEFLKQYSVIIPTDLRIVTHFGGIIKPLFQMIKQNSEENTELVALRDMLTKRFFKNESN